MDKKILRSVEGALALPLSIFVIPSEARDLHFAAHCGSLASLGMTIHERRHSCTARRLSSRVLLYSLSPLGKSRSRLDNFFEHGAATFAHRRVILVLADASRKIPT